MAHSRAYSDILGAWPTSRVSLAGVTWLGVLKQVLAASLVGAGVIVVFEPDHTAGLPLYAAIGLWSTHLFFAFTLFLGSLALLLLVGLPGLVAAMLATLLLPATFAPVSLLLDIGFGKPDEELATAGGLLSAYLGEVTAVAPISVLAALLALVALYRAPRTPDSRDERVEGDRIAGLEGPDVRQLQGLGGAIPRSLGNDIIRLHAQDHYVEVVTAEGRALIMERFSDCVDKLASTEGVQCHRSHWISLHHVAGLSRLGSAYVCALDNGDRVPVSRRRYAELKQRLAHPALKGRARGSGGRGFGGR